MEKKKVGFAVMDPTKRAELSRKGGKSAHAKGTAHQFDHEAAVAAGKKGAAALRRNRRLRAEAAAPAPESV